jgi:hypothetical protein
MGALAGQLSTTLGVNQFEKWRVSYDASNCSNADSSTGIYIIPPDTVDRAISMFRISSGIILFNCEPLQITVSYQVCCTFISFLFLHEPQQRVRVGIWRVVLQVPDLVDDKEVFDCAIRGEHVQQLAMENMMLVRYVKAGGSNLKLMHYWRHCFMNDIPRCANENRNFN